MSTLSFEAKMDCLSFLPYIMNEGKELEQPTIGFCACGESLRSVQEKMFYFSISRIGGGGMCSLKKGGCKERLSTVNE